MWQGFRKWLFGVTLLAISLLLVGTRLAFAQPPKDDPTPPAVTPMVTPVWECPVSDLSPAEITGVDIMLVIDHSGSMDDDGWDPDIGDYQPIGAAKIAAQQFVDLMNLSTDQVGLVSFSSSANLDHQLSEDAGSVKDAIGALTAGGGTAIDEGIIAAWTELESVRHVASNAPGMIVLSDGQNNAGPDPVIIAANRAKQAGIRIFTVGLGIGADQDTLRATASSPDDFYYAPISADLAEIYDKIAGGIELFPQGDLQLHVPEAFDVDMAVIVQATIFNSGAQSAEYRLDLELWRGFSKLDQQSETVLVAWGSERRLTFNFGDRPPHSLAYFIEAELYSQGEEIDSETAYFSIGADYIRTKDAATRLTDAALEETLQAENIVVETLSTAAGKTSVEAVDIVAGKVFEHFLSISDLWDVPGKAYEMALSDLGEAAVSMIPLVESGSSDLAAALARGHITGPRLEGRRTTVANKQQELLDYARTETYTWNPIWENDIRRDEEAIRNRVESYRGLGVHLDLTPPFVHGATLIELKGQFDTWIVDRLLRFLDFISWYVLAILIFAIVAASIIAILVSAGTLAPGTIAVHIPAVISLSILVKYGKPILAGVIVVSFALLTFLNGTGGVINDIVDYHTQGIDNIRSKISGAFTAGKSEELRLRTLVEGHKLGISATAGDELGAPKVYLYSQDGRLFNILTGQDGLPHQVLQDITLSTGKYRVVAAVHNPEELGAVTKRALVTIQSPSVALQVSISQSQIDEGDSLAATIQLGNKSVVSDTGPIMVAAGTLDGDGLGTWELELAPGEQRTIDHQFVPREAGGQVLRVTVSDGWQLLALTDVGFVVGEGPAVVVEADYEMAYPHDGAVTIPLTISNVGTKTTTVSLSVQTFDKGNNMAEVAAISETVELGPGASKSINATVLPEAVPGSYQAQILIADQLYRNLDFLVEAEDTLFASAYVSDISPTSGSQVTVYVDVLDAEFDLTDADVSVAVTAPDGTTRSLSVQRAGTGHYFAETVAGIAGTYEISVEVTKSGYYVIGDSTYFAVEQFSILASEIDGQLVVGRPRPLSVEVINEQRVPIVDASVAVSTTYGPVESQTDDTGKALLYVTQGDATPVKVSIHKQGYAHTSFDLPVQESPDTTDLWLSEDWNLVSFNRELENQATTMVIDPVRRQLVVVLSFEDGGLSYYPNIPPDLNTLSQMDHFHGYWIKTSESVILPVSGPKVSVDTLIELQEGWNLVSYLPDSSQPLTTALSSIQDQYTAVLGYDWGAESYHSQLPDYMDTLHTLRPQHGYWIKMKQAGTLVYPSTGVGALGRFAAGARVNAPQAAPGVTPTNEWVDFYSFNTRMNGQPIPEGSIVTAYDPDGVKIGECVVEQPGSFGVLSVYGDDVLTPEDEGAEPGDTITFYINGYKATAMGSDEPIWTSFGDLRSVNLTATYHFRHKVYLPLILK